MVRRLAFDVGPLTGHRTGIGRAVEELRRHLLERPDVELVPYLLSARTRPQPPTRRAPIPATLAHRLWARVPWPRLDRWFGNVSVIHGTNYVVPPSRHPTLVSVYDAWFFRHPERANPAVRRAGAVLAASIRRGAWVHTSSVATADVVATRFETDRIVPIHLAPLPVVAGRAGDEPPPRPAGLGRAPYLLALGTHEHRKNLPHLVAAFGLVADRLDHDLVLAGAPGDASADLAAAVDRLGANGPARVHVLGAVDEPTKAALLAHAAALVYPSLDEGFGFPVLEAQTAGVPVVATSVGSVPEVGGHGVLLVDVDDREALAQALVDVTHDDGRRAELVAAGTRNLARFSWATTAERFADTYRRLAEGADPQ